MIPHIDLPAKLVPVFTGPAMYRGAYGGRGSAKTRSFAKMAAVQGVRFAQANLPGVIVCGREFMNSLDDSSLAEVKGASTSRSSACATISPASNPRRKSACCGSMRPSP